MSKFHGEQYWTTVRQSIPHNWRDFDDDEFDAWRAIAHEHDVREHSVRERLRRERRRKPKDPDA